MRSALILLQCLLQVDVNSALGENSKEPSSSTISIEASFDDDSKSYSNIACPNPTEGATENIG